MDYAYSPYHKKKHEKKPKKWKGPKIKMPSSWGKWIAILISIILLLLFGLYWSLGGLRFFANHYFGLTFFSKNYLIVLQNNYELRPGGGFITAYGDLSTFMGWPTELSFKNSYDISSSTYITPPYPHEELLKNEWYEGFTFRDANWSPDFPENVPILIDFYQQKFPKKQIDGIITMNFSLFEELVDVFGSIELNGKRYDKNNLFSELEFEVNNIDRHNLKALNDRKNILGELAAAMLKEVRSHPYKVRDVILEGLNTKDLYIWLKNERLQNMLAEKGWTNELIPTDRSDFLAVNLANLGSKKADRYVQPEVHYYANITKELPEITTEVTLRYPGFTNTYSDNYKGYLRLYLPKDADVSSSPVDSIVEIEGEFKVVGTKIILPAGSKSSLVYVYTLPRNTFLRDQYQLRLIKQSGSETFYKVTVEAPRGTLMESDSLDTRENRASFQGKLENDMDFSLRILPDTTPPYPIEQEFEDLGKINIIWNEPVDPLTAEDGKNYKVTDLNFQNTKTDQVNVISAKLVEPNIVQLGLEGVTEQIEEHYRIEMNAVTDLAKNQIIPNPKSITAIQRIKADSGAPEIRLGEIPQLDELELPAEE